MSAQPTPFSNFEAHAPGRLRRMAAHRAFGPNWTAVGAWLDAAFVRYGEAQIRYGCDADGGLWSWEIMEELRALDARPTRIEEQ